MNASTSEKSSSNVDVRCTKPEARSRKTFKSSFLKVTSIIHVEYIIEKQLTLAGRLILPPLSQIHSNLEIFLLSVSHGMTAIIIYFSIILYSRFCKFKKKKNEIT